MRGGFVKLSGSGNRHLTYCTNIHPGESWTEVRENLARYLLPVREQVAPGKPFGVGLRLSGRAARELGEGDHLAELGSFLGEHDLYVFTINGFPHGAFHGRPVKEEVYRPDWLEEERLGYSNQLADLLSALLPEGMEGTISTVPGAFAPRVGGDDDSARIAARIARHVHHLLRLEEATGRRIALALEPEPCCHVETVDQAVRLFEHQIFGRPGVETLARDAGLSPAAAETALRRHVGLCFDTCHMAVEFEDPAAALGRITAAGIRLLKVQVSAGLRADLGGGDDAAIRRALERFADDVYLHQVVERRPDGAMRRYIDLPDALAAPCASVERREWRVHFHVPLFYARLGLFESTQAYVREALDLLRNAECEHFEVETYTWDVLPEEYRSSGIVSAVARELVWTATHLRAAPAKAIA
jgi:sugar phosphate isomerase/epimerase